MSSCYNPIFKIQCLIHLIYFFYKYIFYKKGTIVNDCQATTTKTTTSQIIDFSNYFDQISNNSNYVEQATLQLINMANQILNYVFFF